MRGPWKDPRAYPALLDDWETHRVTDFNPDPNGRRLPEDYPVNDSESPITPLMYNAVGGSTIHWSAHFPRMHPSDFRVRSLDGVADDWPVTYEELEPYFDLNDRMMGVAGMVGDTAYPPKSDRQTPPIPLGKLGETMAGGFDKLGWHWWPSDTAILTRPYDGRSACNNCGPCEIGCPLGAKASTDVTYWPRAIAGGAVLKTGCRVREVTVGRDGLATGVVYYDEEGRVREQKARVVVMACNGVGTPRLLLNSRSGLFPDGLSNGNGLVGRNLMFHPYAMVTGVFDDLLEGYKGPSADCIMSSEFYETDLSRGFVRGVAFQIIRSSGPFVTALGFAGAPRVPWGSGHHRAFAQRFGRTITIAVVGEDLPEPSNRVTLDSRPRGRRRHPGPQGLLPDEREQPEDDGLRRRQGLRGVAGRRRPRGDGQSPPAPLRVAPPGHRPHGLPRRRLRRGRERPQPRGEEPLRHRRQRLHHRGGGEPHVDHPGGGSAHRRPLQEDLPTPAGLRCDP